MKQKRKEKDLVALAKASATKQHHQKKES